MASGTILKANNTSLPFCSLHHSSISVLIFKDSLSLFLVLSCGQAHTSVIFAHLSSSHSARSHHTLNIHKCGSISWFFQNFPFTFSRQTRPKNLIYMHMLPSHLQAFSSYTALLHIPLLSLSTFSKDNSLLFSHISIFPALLPHLLHLSDPSPFSLCNFFERLVFFLHCPEFSPAICPSWTSL